MRSAMENAFWDNIASGLAQEPTDYKRVVDLVGEVREELEALVPESWKDELRESMDLELITQVCLHSSVISFCADAGITFASHVVLIFVFLWVCVGVDFGFRKQ